MDRAAISLPRPAFAGLSTELLTQRGDGIVGLFLTHFTSECLFILHVVFLARPCATHLLLCAGSWSCRSLPGFLFSEQRGVGRLQRRQRPFLFAVDRIIGNSRFIETHSSMLAGAEHLGRVAYHTAVRCA